MPYALSGLEDGKAPAWRAIPSEDDAEAGEVVVGGVPAGHVWDAAAGALRPPSEGEELERARAGKLDEIAGLAIADLAPLFTEGKGRDETALLVAAHVLKLCEALKVPADPRLAAVVQTGQKALAKKAAVEGASSVEEVEGVSWT